MSHTISTLLRKAPFIKQLDGDKGTMFAIELSEMVKDYKTGEKVYSNYKAILFAKSEAAANYYNDALAEGSFVVISCDKLKTETREHEGKTYVSLVMDNARLDAANYSKPDSSPGMQQQAQQGNFQSQQQQPQQSQAGFAPAPQQGFNHQSQGDFAPAPQQPTQGYVPSSGNAHYSGG